jgi:hypothetical protein
MHLADAAQGGVTSSYTMTPASISSASTPGSPSASRSASGASSPHRGSHVGVLPGALAPPGARAPRKPPSSTSPERRRQSREALAPRHTRRASLSLVAWIPIGDMEYPSWVLEGRHIGATGRGSPWWLGDWLHYGTAKWGERYADAAKITGYDPKSLRNMRYVASRFKPSLRRDNLTWSHHALLVALTPDAQTYWLDRAAADKFTVNDLRIELRGAHRSPHAGAGGRSLSPTTDEDTSQTELQCPRCGYQLSLARDDDDSSGS